VLGVLVQLVQQELVKGGARGQAGGGIEEQRRWGAQVGAGLGGNHAEQGVDEAQHLRARTAAALELLVERAREQHVRAGGLAGEEWAARVAGVAHPWGKRETLARSRRCPRRGWLSAFGRDP